MKPTRKRPGPKPKPPGEKYEVKAITLHPKYWRWIEEQGGSRGGVIAPLVAAAMKKEVKDENIRR